MPLLQCHVLRKLRGMDTGRSDVQSQHLPELEIVRRQINPGFLIRILPRKKIFQDVVRSSCLYCKGSIEQCDVHCNCQSVLLISECSLFSNKGRNLSYSDTSATCQAVKISLVKYFPLCFQLLVSKKLRVTITIYL